MVTPDTPYITALNRAIRQTKKLTAQFETVRRSALQGRFDDSFEQGFETIHKAEKIALLARALPCYTGNPQAKNKVDDAVLHDVPVEIGFTDQGWFLMRLPLLPPKKEKGDSLYLRDTLYIHLRHAFSNCPPVRFRNATMVFRHVYDESDPKKKLRDYDNVDTKALIDAIALYVMPDDSPRHCCQYHCCDAGPQEFTEVYVLPDGVLPAWLSVKSKFPKEGLAIIPPEDFATKKQVAKPPK